MNSGAQSSIHLMTGKTPLTKVERHKPKMTETKDGAKRNSPLTNEYLKKGGRLPSVLPPSDSNPAPVVSSESSSRRKSTNPATTREPHIPNVSESQRQPMTTLNTCGLEKKMESLSCKLSKVQDIILSHIADTGEMTKNENFSAHDYRLLILEMNGHIPSCPYDPIEFSTNENKET